MTKRNIFKGYLLVAVLLVSALGKTQESNDPLDNYLKVAMQHNPDLKSIFNQYMSILERMPQAKSLPDPTLMFNVFASPVETRVGAQNAGISISQAFPWFGKLKSQEEAVAFLAKSKFEAFEDAKNRLMFDVKSTYYDYYVLAAAIRILEENITLLESLREMANVRIESNQGSAVDFLRAEIEIDQLNTQLLYLMDSKLPLQAKFKELLNTEMLQDLRIPDSLNAQFLLASKQVLRDSVLAQNPQLRALDYKLNSVDSKIEVARKAGLPSFNVGVAYTNISPRTDLDVPNNGKDALILPQIGVKLPLYRSKYRAMVKEQELMKNSISFEKENRENELETLLEKSWRDYTDANRRVDLYKRLLGYAEQSLEILITEYTTAGADFEEVLRMEKQLLNFALELEKSLADQNTYVAFINYLTAKK